MVIAKFFLNNAEYVAIECEDINSTDDLVLWADWVKIFFISKSDKTKLFHDYPGEALHLFKVALSQVLNAKVDCGYLQNYDIGFLYNDYNREEPLFIQDQRHKNKFVTSSLFESTGDYTVSTWLYQNEQEELIFEVTPNYPWTYRDPDPDEHFIEYEEWMKNYKPLVKRVLSPEVVKQWTKQLDELYAKVKENDERLRCKGPGCQECLKQNSK